MRRLAIVAALLASLASAPTAGATEFTVNDRGDDSDNNLLDGACATAAAKCTLRAALEQANAASDADLIVFHGALGTTTIAPTTPLPRIVTRVTIDGGDRITIAPGAPAAAATDVALIDFKATVVAPASSSAGSTVRRIVLDGRPDGGGAYRAGPLIRIAVGDVTIETIVARNSAGNAIDLTANAQRVHITRSPVFAFAPGSKAIALAAGANGNVAAPQDLRVGPRRADGTLQVTGNSGGGTVELFRGDPATGPQTFANEAPGGSFAFTLNPEPAPGEKLSATLTDPGGNTSEFSPTASAPADLESPRLLGGVAISRNEVRVHASEALHPATVQAEDFALRMAGSDRSVIGASLSPDGAFVTLTSSTPWLYGEAGTVALRTPAAFTDSAGNESPSVLTTARVGGAPGDFDAPRVTVLRINPRRKVCVSKGPRCSKPGTEVSFLSSEDGEAVFTLRRGSHVLGQRRYAVEPGRNRIRYDGRLRGRKLSAGAYKLYVGVEDAVGNIAPLQPSLEFRIVKTRR